MQSIISCAQLEDAVEEERLHLASNEVDVEDVESFKHQLKGLYRSVLLLNGCYVCVVCYFTLFRLCLRSGLF